MSHQMFGPTHGLEPLHSSSKVLFPACNIGYIGARSRTASSMFSSVWRFSSQDAVHHEAKREEKHNVLGECDATTVRRACRSVIATQCHVGRTLSRRRDSWTSWCLRSIRLLRPLTLIWKCIVRHTSYDACHSFNFSTGWFGYCTPFACVSGYIRAIWDNPGDVWSGAQFGWSSLRPAHAVRGARHGGCTTAKNCLGATTLTFALELLARYFVLPTSSVQAIVFFIEFFLLCYWYTRKPVQWRPIDDRFKCNAQLLG